MLQTVIYAQTITNMETCREWIPNLDLSSQVDTSLFVITLHLNFTYLSFAPRLTECESLLLKFIEVGGFNLCMNGICSRSILVPQCKSLDHVIVLEAFVY